MWCGGVYDSTAPRFGTLWQCLGMSTYEQVWNVAAAQVRNVAGLNAVEQVWNVAAAQVRVVLD